jgi:hypothetical protein
MASNFHVSSDDVRIPANLLPLRGDDEPNPAPTDGLGDPSGCIPFERVFC